MLLTLIIKLPKWAHLSLCNDCRDMTQRRCLLRAHFWVYFYRKISEAFSLKSHFQSSTYRATGTPILALYEFLGRFYDYLVTYRSRFSIFLGFFWPFLGQNFPIFMIFRVKSTKSAHYMTQEQKFENPALYVTRYS